MAEPKVVKCKNREKKEVEAMVAESTKAADRHGRIIYQCPHCKSSGAIHPKEIGVAFYHHTCHAWIVVLG